MKRPQALPPSDDLSALMRAARDGDDEAYRRLLGQLSVWLRGVARRGLVRAGRGIEESEDIVQETLLAMHLKRDSWDPAQPVEPWLAAIARHKLVDFLRRRGFHDHLDIDDQADILPAPEAEEAGASADARQMLAGLPERQRAIVTAISIEGQSARDTGLRLGMTEGAVRVVLHRALKALAVRYRKEAP
jgi:RNA polymerase sigma-70 factor (ECF subfamily)